MGTNDNYNWKRFWYPRDKSYKLSERGYLLDPETSGWFTNPYVVPFSKIESKPCLVLLGEPGSGKTTIIEKVEEEYKKTANEADEKKLFFDLKNYNTDDYFEKKVFENSEIRDWANDGSKRLYLFLDSLDEGRIHVTSLVNLLGSKLREVGSNNLFLRIVCRSAEWPGSLEDTLKELWGSDNVGVYELAPLRRKDVEEAARKRLKAGHEKFIDAVEKKDAVPFAIKPITLKFLMNRYKRDGNVPNNRFELYHEGCLNLCTEPDEDRPPKNILDDEHRLLLSARIAATMMFSDYHAIWKGSDRGDVPKKDITLRELTGREVYESSDITVKQTFLKETVETGLFTSSGAKRRRFYHQTYLEFLAAYYLIERNVQTEQTMSMICTPSGKIYPQLREVAAWLACVSAEIRDHLLTSDPEVLLRSDISKEDDSIKEKLVDELLKLYEAEKSNIKWDLTKHYKNLYYPGLLDKLRPYIADKALKDKIVREFAIDVARECILLPLQEELFNIVFDNSDVYAIRSDAAHALVQIADDKLKSKFRSILKMSEDEDPSDLLKVSALQALWPNHISVKEMLKNFSLLKNRDAQSVFIITDSIQHLNEDGLVTALKWVEKQPAIYKNKKELYYIAELINIIILKVWDYIKSTDSDIVILKAFVKTIISRIKLGDKLPLKFYEELKENDIKRRVVLKVLVPLQKSLTDKIHQYFFVLVRNDITWFIEQIKYIRGKNKETWFEALDACLAYNSCIMEPQEFEDLIDELRNLPKKLKDELKKRIENEISRKEHAKQWENAALQYSLQPIERIKSHLDDFEKGSLDSWRLLNCFWSEERDEEDAYYYDQMSQITNRWDEFDETTQMRIVKAGETYIGENFPKSIEWLENNGDSNIIKGAIVFVRVIYDLKKLHKIPASIWKKLASFILLCHTYRPHIIDNQIQRELIKQAYKRTPNEMIKALSTVIDRENEQQGYVYIVRDFDDCWDDKLENFLLKKVKGESIKPECMYIILKQLMIHDNNGAQKYAESFLKPLNKDEEKTIAATIVLIEHPKDIKWQMIWRIITDNPEFGKRLIEAVAQKLRWSVDELGERLTEKQLADLYLLLDGKYPHGRTDNITLFKNAILNSLVNRGTDDACKEIEDIIKKAANPSGYKWLLLDARDITLRNKWKTFEPKEFLELKMSPKKAEMILCLQKIPGDRSFKNYYAELAYSHGNSTKKEYFKLGPLQLRFHYLVLSEKLKGRKYVDENTLKGALHYDNTSDNSWFSKRIGEVKDWLKNKPFKKHYKFTKVDKKHQVSIDLNESEISILDIDYETAVKETKQKVL
jgi:hypothetical protein